MKGIKRKAVTVAQVKKEVLRNIGKKLKKRRKALGYGNSDDFAYETGINRSQYGRYEAGKKDLRIGTLLRIVNSMGLTIEEFFAEESDSQ